MCDVKKNFFDVKKNTVHFTSFLDGKIAAKY